MTTKTNTAEKRLRMHQIMKIWRGIWISISKTKTCLLIGQKLVKQTRKYSKRVDYTLIESVLAFKVWNEI
jgi:hypothetical protein